MILILNHKTQNCGVYQFGRRFANLASQSKVHHVEYREIETPADYEYCLHLKPDIIIFNWYPITMNWLRPEHIKSDIKNYFIFHDGHIWSGSYDKYIFNGALGPPEGALKRIPEDKRVILSRPLFSFNNALPKNEVTNIGSFGFGFWHKGFDEVVRKVNAEFDKAIINLHIPNAHFGDADGSVAREVIKRCISLNTNPNITLNVTTGLISDQELLNFLAKNDLNIFMYSSVNEGLSSVLDYALSVKRPIALTDNMMFRHILSDEIKVEKNTLKEIIEKGLAPIEKFQKQWSPEEFIKEFDKEFVHEVRKQVIDQPGSKRFRIRNRRDVHSLS